MNDRQELENLKVQSRWSGKRFVLIYWVALMFLGTGFAIGLGAGVLSPKYEAAQYDHDFDEPWHPGECKSCHGDGDSIGNDEWLEWSTTSHGSAMSSNATHVIFQHAEPTWAEFNTTCGQCHATNWNQTDFDTNGDTGDMLFWDIGITCAACHEPGVIDYTDEGCNGCHGAGAYHSNRMTEDHNMSLHNQSLANILARAGDIDECLHCMTGQSLFWAVGDPRVTRDNNASLTAITCSTCHDPHNGTNGGQLRFDDASELCGQCHGSLRIESSHATYDFFTSGDGGDAHGGMDCNDCHGYTPGSHGAVMNHTWLLNPDFGCNGSRGDMDCHTNTTVQLMLVEGIQDNINETMFEILDKVEDAMVKVDAANATANVNKDIVDLAYDMLEEAELLVGGRHPHAIGDDAGGFHNPATATGYLYAAEELVVQAEALAAKAVATAAPPVTVEVPTTVVSYSTTTVSAPGFELFGLLFAFTLLGAAVLLFRKRTL